MFLVMFLYIQADGSNMAGKIYRVYIFVFFLWIECTQDFIISFICYRNTFIVLTAKELHLGFIYAITVDIPSIVDVRASRSNA